MFKKVKLTNFKGILQGEVKFKPLTILLGSNNSGKTSIIESLFLAPNPHRSVPYNVDNAPNTAIGVLHALHKTLDSEGYVFIMNNYNEKIMKIECETFKNVIEWTYTLEENYIQINYLLQNYDDIEVSTTSRGFSRLSTRNAGGPTIEEKLCLNSLLINAGLLTNAYEYIRDNWARIVNEKYLKETATNASLLSNDNYSNFTIEPFLSNRMSLNAYLEDGRRIRLGDIGQGVQNFIIANLLYQIVNPDCLLWDDIESHLNPKILVALGNWFSQITNNDKQVIITTHSMEVANIMSELNQEKTSIILTSLKDGLLKTKEMSRCEFDEYYNAGIDLRTAEGFLL